MDLPFRDFIAAYNDGSIVEDASWRAYDIEEMSKKEGSLSPGLKIVYGISASEVAANYGIHSQQRAETLLKMWHTWRSIALGWRKRGLIERRL